MEEGASTELQEVVTFNDEVPGGLAAALNVAKIRNKIKALGPRPDAITVKNSRRALIEIESNLAEELEGIIFSSPPEGADMVKWQASQSEKENAIKQESEKVKISYRTVLQLDELHQLYNNLLKETETLLERGNEESTTTPATPHEDSTILGVGKTLEEAFQNNWKELNLSKMNLGHVPESIGQLSSLSVLSITFSQVKVLPDSIAGLVNLVKLDLESNLLEHLPDSIGLLTNLKFLNVSKNQLKLLPESIVSCRSLVELNADFNTLEYLPSNLGYGLENLENLSVDLNKLTILPSSIGDLKSLRQLDVHFNKLTAIPATIGRLSKLERLNASSNFSDLVNLPETIGDLVSLSYLDLSFNQIKELPISMGRLENLKTLKLDENPLIEPPLEIVNKGHAAVMEYLKKRLDVALGGEYEGEEGKELVNRGWIPVSSSSFSPSSSSSSSVAAAAAATAQESSSSLWGSGWISGIYGSISNYISNVAPVERDKDDYLNQER